jgi:hypothetical protein
MSACTTSLAAPSGNDDAVPLLDELGDDVAADKAAAAEDTDSSHRWRRLSLREPLRPGVPHGHVGSGFGEG